MHPPGINLAHRFEHEEALMHTGMRQRQLWSIGHDGVYGYKIYVYAAICIGARTVAVRRRVDGMFHGLKAPQDPDGRSLRISFYHQADIQKREGGIEAPGLGLHHLTSATGTGDSLTNGSDRSLDESEAVATVRSDVDVYAQNRQRVFFTSTSSKASMMSPSATSL